MGNSSLDGEPGRSLKIRLTGPKAGVWRYLSEGIGGSDPISLVPARYGLSQSEAAQHLADILGLKAMVALARGGIFDPLSEAELHNLQLAA